MNQLLAESGMRHHPVNPMTDSYLPRLVEAQSTGRCGVVSAHVFEQGVKAVRQELARLQQEGYRYAVLDALTEHHLEIQGSLARCPTGNRRFWSGDWHGPAVGARKR